MREVRWHASFEKPVFELAEALRSMIGGRAPVPNAALRLRSSTELLLPSQCSSIGQSVGAGLARKLPPDRREVDRADLVLFDLVIPVPVRQILPPPVEDAPSRVAEGVDTAGTPVGLRLSEKTETA